MLAVNVVRHRFKGDSGDEVMLNKAVRAHGNNIEYVPITLIGLALLAMTGATAQTISILGGTLVVARVSHAYGITRPTMPNPFGYVGNIGTWLIMLCIAVSLIMSAVSA